MPHNTAYIDPPGMLQCVCCVFVCVCMCVNLLSCQPLLSRRGAHTPRGKANNAHQLHIQASAHTVQQFVSELAGRTSAHVLWVLWLVDGLASCCAASRSGSTGYNVIHAAK